LEWSTNADNLASGRAYGGAGASGSLINDQPGVWSAGGRLIIVVRVRCVIRVLHHDPRVSASSLDNSVREVK